MNVANHAALVDDDGGGPGDPLSRVKHPEVLNDSLLRVRNQQIPDAQLPRRLVHFKRIVRADGDDFGLQPMNFFGKSLELDELPLANHSEVTPIEDQHEVFPALEFGELEALYLETTRLLPHLGAVLIERRRRPHARAHEDESERQRRRTHGTHKKIPAPFHREKPPSR